MHQNHLAAALYANLLGELTALLQILYLASWMGPSRKGKEGREMNEGKEEWEGGKEEGRKVERNGARGKVEEGGDGPRAGRRENGHPQFLRCG